MPTNAVFQLPEAHPNLRLELVDILCSEIDVCARFAGGNNAGHTIVVDMAGPDGVKKPVKFDFHILPSGACALPTRDSTVR